jgi:hypothetical protein
VGTPAAVVEEAWGISPYLENQLGRCADVLRLYRFLG